MKKKFLIDVIVGARPNFIKVSALYFHIRKYKKYNQYIKFRLIHTGQHYSKKLSQDFINQLKIPAPNYNLKVGSGSVTQQISKIMIRYEKILAKKKCDICLVVGDVNSTVACAMSAKRFNIKIAHIESGLRSNDLSMPEEINRIITDSITDFHFTTSKYANKNLLNEGVKKNKIFFVGNIMIDTLYNFSQNKKAPKVWYLNNLKRNSYILVTLHRPSNVDHSSKLKKIVKTLEECASEHKIIFPVHPRTQRILKKINLQSDKLIYINALPYLEFNFLLKNSNCVITDSGGITEEATVYKIPCITLRKQTERPETVEVGSNILIGDNLEKNQKICCQN